MKEKFEEDSGEVKVEVEADVDGEKGEVRTEDGELVYEGVNCVVNLPVFDISQRKRFGGEVKFTSRRRLVVSLLPLH